VSLVGLISQYIEHFTYAGLFVVLMLCGLGLPIPEDVALLAGGYLVHRGITRYPITLAVSLFGVVAGDNSLFFMGRHFGTGLVRYFSIGRPGRKHQIERIEGFMQRHGHRAIFYARFLAGLRALVYLSAGSFGVRPGVFLFYDLLGALISVPIVVTLGYVFGKQLELLVKYIGGFDKLIVVVAVLSLLVYLTRLLVIRKTVVEPAAKSEGESAEL
jgi:membrane protein DedA with SNARE-associated domain